MQAVFQSNKKFHHRVLQLFPILHKNRVHSTVMNQFVDTVYINCNFEVQLSFASHDFRIHFMDYGFDVQFCNVASICGFVGRNQ